MVFLNKQNVNFLFQVVLIALNGNEFSNIDAVNKLKYYLENRRDVLYSFIAYLFTES